MDISSRYYGLLSRNNSRLLSHLWHFFIAVYRVGKIRELISFCLWEIKHQLHLYAIRQYLQFTPGKGLLLEELCPSVSFQATEGVCFEPLAIDWRYCLEDSRQVVWGCCFSSPTTLSYTNDAKQAPNQAYTFPAPIDSMFISRRDLIFVASGGVIYKSADRGATFSSILALSSSISYFLYNNGMTELPNQVLLLGEYGSIWNQNGWQNMAFLYSSTDEGETWQKSDFLQRKGVNKHIHLVRYSPSLKATLLTDGDNKKQLWLNRSLLQFTEASSQADGWGLVNRFHHQRGGYLSIAESDTMVLLGSDYLGGTNCIVRTQDGRRFERAILPDPYRRSPVMNMVTRKDVKGGQIWAVTYSCLSSKNRCLLMYSNDQGRTWTKVIEYDGTRYEVRVVNSSVNPSTQLFISITQYADQPDKPHAHQVYALRAESHLPLTS